MSAVRVAEGGEAGPAPLRFSLHRVQASDGPALADLRVQAMRSSLETVGRFDPQRARARFLDHFDPASTRAVHCRGRRAGVVVLRGAGAAWQLDHFYILPAFQGQGLGAAVLRRICAEADQRGQPIRLGALKGSAANRFYQRHGFVQVAESEWDLHYLRPAAATAT